MSFLLARRPSLVRPAFPTVNRGHWGAQHLRFAYNGNATGRGVRGLVGAETALMTQVGSAGVAISRDGFGVVGNAADSGFYAVARQPSSFAGDITLLWRGVILGDPGGSNYGLIFGVTYGNAIGAPWSVFSLQRPQTNVDIVEVHTNTGASFCNAGGNFALSSLYNRPLTIAASNVAGSSTLIMTINDGRSSFLNVVGTLTSASGAPRLTSSTDRIQIGENLGAGRFPNSVTTAAAIWSRAFNQRQMLDLVQNSADVFAPRGMVIPFSITSFTAPEIAVTGNGNAITDGDATPSATDHTDFGTTPQGTTKSRTFTITNDGDANLTISSVALSGADAAEFSVTTDPTGTIAPAGTGTLVVTALATTQGTFAATVTINSNDANEAAFDFAITVEVTEPAADDDGGIPFSPATAITFSPSGLLIR